MKFTAINYRTKEVAKNLNLSDIKISSHNPRYTTLTSLDEDILKVIKDISSETQEEIAKKLLSNEGDFSDFKNLLTSIENIGFKSMGEQILLIKDKDYYVVAEGNRRILALKLIFANEIVMPEYEKIVSFSIDANEAAYFDEDDDKNYLIRRKANYIDILNLIKKIQAKNLNFEIEFEEIVDSQILWRMIYTKHIAGVRPGMRQWSRGKYFTDILSFFKNGIKAESDIGNKTRESIQREPKAIIDDFKRAQFIKEVIKSSEKFAKNFSDLTDEEIFDRMKKIKVSGLQYDFSVKRLADSAKHILNIDSQKFRDKYFSFHFNELNLIVFNENRIISPREILKFIYEWYSRGYITTRPIPPKKKAEFDLAVKKLLTKTAVDTKTQIPAEKLKVLDSFDFSIKELEEILKIGRQNKVEEEILKRYEATKDIKKNNESFLDLPILEFLQEADPKLVFGRLISQYSHNQNNWNFLNAAASTLRSMIEQIIVWGAYFVDDVVEDTIPGDSLVENKRNQYVGELAEGKIHKLYSDIRKNHFTRELDVQNCLEAICKDKKEEESKFIVGHVKEIDEVLNEFIHASHRIYSPHAITESLIKMGKWQRVILSIIKDIDNEKIENLNLQIRNAINS